VSGLGEKIVDVLAKREKWPIDKNEFVELSKDAALCVVENNVALDDKHKKAFIMAFFCIRLNRLYEIIFALKQASAKVSDGNDRAEDMLSQLIEASVHTLNKIVSFPEDYATKRFSVDSARVMLLRMDILNKIGVLETVFSTKYLKKVNLAIDFYLVVKRDIDSIIEASIEKAEDGDDDDFDG